MNAVRHVCQLSVAVWDITSVNYSTGGAFDVRNDPMCVPGAVEEVERNRWKCAII